MKKYILLFATIALTINGIAQGNSPDKGKNDDKTVKGKKGKFKSARDNNDTWNEASNTSLGKSSKNQPAKVRAGFQRDYPNAANVVWSKYRGDWTATYNSAWGRSTAVYHANGQRKDTRSNINRNQLPTETIWDRIFKRDRVNVVGNIVHIESPFLRSEIFRITSLVAGASVQYLYYNRSGQRITYDF